MRAAALCRSSRAVTTARPADAYRAQGLGPALGEWSLVPIFALGNEHNPDPAMRSYTKPVTAELREKLIVGIAVGEMKIYRYFEARRMTDMNPTYRRMGPKVGRNDLCPCGSGKKFKHCCGKITLH
jgi:uncharacterized protein